MWIFSYVFSHYYEYFLLQIQQNKQSISSLKRKHTDSIEDLRPGDEKHRNNPRWTNDELMLAIQVI